MWWYVLTNDDDDEDDVDVDAAPHVAGAHEPTALHGRLDKLLGRLSPQENVQGVHGIGRWEI